MYLQKIKPFNSSKRFEQLNFLDKAFLFKNKDKFFTSNRNLAGRDNKTGKIIIFSKSKSKKKKVILNKNFFNNIKVNSLYYIAGLKKIKNKNLFLAKNSLGNILTLPFIFGSFLNDYFFFFFKVIRNNFILGKKTFLFFSLNNFFLSNIGSSDRNSWLAKSNGTFCFKRNYVLDYKIFILILPSKKKKTLNWFNTCYLGRNSNINWKYQFLSSYKNNFLLGNKQSVRGVAMNPVDHPHGGRTKTNKPEVSPWGWVAKKGH